MPASSTHVCSRVARMTRGRDRDAERYKTSYSVKGLGHEDSDYAGSHTK